MKKTATYIGVLSSLFALASCGGSGGAGAPSTPVLAGQDVPGATQTQSISAASGGKIVIAGGGTPLTLVIPPAALAADAVVSVAEYDRAVPRAAGAQAPGALPVGAVFLGGFTVSTGGVPLMKPLRVSISVAAGASSQGALYLGMCGPGGRYANVDTASAANGVISNDDARTYVGISSASGSAAPYAVYALPAPAPTAAPIAVTVAAATPGPYAIGGSATFTATAADANGNPYAFTPVFSLSNPMMGAITPSATDPSKGTAAFGAMQQNGFVQAADARSGVHGSLNISIQSTRPANDGDTYAYAGTLTQEFDRILPDAMPPSTTTSAVTQTVTVRGGQTFGSIPNVYDFVTAETDAGPLQTTTSHAHAFEGVATTGGLTQFLQYGSTWDDGVGDTLSYVYPQSLLLDELPQSAGRTWSNTAAATITENETVGTLGAAFAAQRLSNADGTYTEISTYPAGYFGQGSAADHGTIVENPDGSGSYSVPIYGAGDVVFGAPANGTIPYSVYAQASPQPTDKPLLAATIRAWYPSPPVFFKESDSDTGSTAIPAECKASPSFGAQAEKVVQQIDRLDTILGYTESTTSATYLVPGYGAVCIELSDVQTWNYDFQGDSLALFYGQPYQTTKVSEVLGLQQAGTNVIGSSAATRRTSSAALFRLAGTGAFARAVAHNRIERQRAFVLSLQRSVRAHNRGVK